MKRQLTLAALILALGAGLTWHNHQQLAASRAEQARLLDQAASRGMSVDPEHPGNIMLPSKLPRPSREEEIKQLASSFIAYIDAMQPTAHLLDTSDPALRDKITQQMDQLRGLDADQWEMLIHEVFTRTDHPATYQGLIGLAFQQLAKDRPAKAAEVLLATPGLVESVGWFVPEGLISEALRQMMESDRQAALDWFTANRARMRPELAEETGRGLIFQLAKEDPRLALKLVDDFKVKQPESLVPQIFRRPSGEERNASLALLREWQTARNLPMGSELHRESLEALAFKSNHWDSDERASFAENSAWMDQAGLRTEEFQILGENLINRIQIKDGGQWIGWLHEHTSSEMARDESARIFSEWLRNDYKAAGTWLEEHPEIPGRNGMARELTKQVAKRDPELAARFAQGLPEEDPEDSAEEGASGGASVGISVGVGASIFEDEEEEEEEEQK